MGRFAAESVWWLLSDQSEDTALGNLTSLSNFGAALCKERVRPSQSSDFPDVKLRLETQFFGMTGALVGAERVETLHRRDKWSLRVS